MPTEQEVLKSINANPNMPHAGEDTDKNEGKRGKLAEVREFVWETIKLVVICLAIIIPIRYYLVQPFFVKGASMETNFEDGDYILIDEISYRLAAPARGDVIVFRYPEDPSVFYIKRIIGLPGETVDIKNNTVTIYNGSNPNGLLLKEGYLSQGQETLGNVKVKLGDGEFFVMGDNRLQSSDSRRWGPVPVKNITGRAFVRLWPISAIESVPKITY